MPQALPANPNLDWLKKTAKQRLVQLRTSKPDAKLHEAQFALAHDYGFKSWRALKSHVDSIGHFRDRNRVFQAARAGDVEAVRRAFASGFDPATLDADGRTVHQIAKHRGHEAIEMLARDLQGGKTRPDDEMQAIQAIMRAAQSGDLDALRAGLDAHPEWIDALGGGFEKATALHLAVLRNQHAAMRLLIERGADLNRRDFPDNAAPLHFAAVHGDMETIRLLVEAGADVDGNGDDHGVGVLGWATCFVDVRQEVASYLLDHGAKLNLWTAIALDRADELRAMVAEDRSLLSARMTRNQHRCTPLHHAVRKNRPRIVQLLLELGADPNARDATGATRVDDRVGGGRGPEHRRGPFGSRAQARLADGGEHGRVTARPRPCCGTIPPGSVLTALIPSPCMLPSASETWPPFAGCWRMASTSTPSGRCGTSITPRSI